VQLACWRVPPSSDQLRELLVFGVRYLTKRRLLARVMACGMDQDVWGELSSALIDFSNELLATSLALRPLSLAPHKSPYSGPSALIASLKSALSDGHPVLCGFGGALDHYTVLAGYSKHRLTLFDSSGLCWIEQRSIGTPECERRHWVYAESARAVVDTW
jgi:hypothetical protein